MIRSIPAEATADRRARGIRGRQRGAVGFGSALLVSTAVLACLAWTGAFGSTLVAVVNVAAFSVAVLWAGWLMRKNHVKRRRSDAALVRERLLIGHLHDLADAANQPSLDEALKHTLEVLLQDGAAQWGVSIGCLNSEVRSAHANWLPGPQGTLPDSIVILLGELAKDLSGPASINLPDSLGLGSVSGSLIPVHDGVVVAGAVFISGSAPMDQARNTARLYAMEQLSRAARRQRVHDQLSDALSRHEALFSCASEAIFTIDDSDRIERLNPAAEQMFGYRPEEAEQRAFAMLLEEPVSTAKLSKRLLFPPESAKSISREATARRKDGATFPAELSLSAMNLGNRTLFVAFVRDISERKKVERIQAEFVSTVSHELRTPLTSISGSLGLVIAGAAGNVGDRAKRLIEIAHANSQRLIRLVNDILDIEKLQSGGMAFRFSDVPIEDFLTQVVTANRAYAENFGVRIVQTGSVGRAVVKADLDRLDQALTNLLSNAVKFSPPGGQVEVSVSQRAGNIRISVGDRGPGIADEFRHRIFERFAQADSSDTRQKGGSGLGLSIVREIAQRHGGSISFETELGEGSVFHLEIPELGPKHHERVPAVSFAERPRVLVCTNNQSRADAIGVVLSGAGFGFATAFTGQEAFAAVAKGATRALIIDLPFRGLAVAQFVKALSDRSGGRTLPLVLLSLDGAGRAAAAIPFDFQAMAWVTNKSDLARLPEIVRSLADHQVRILHIEDDRDVVELVRQALGDDFVVLAAQTLKIAREQLARDHFHLVILDLTLSDGSGEDLIPTLVDAAGTRIPTVVFSAKDASPELVANVDVVLTKSRASLTTLTQAVREVLKLPADTTEPPDEARPAIAMAAPNGQAVRARK